MRELQVWTDGDLDDALAALHADVDTSPAATARARVALLDAITVAAERPVVREMAGVGMARSRGRRFGGPARWMAAAAAVMVLVGGGIVAQLSGPGGASAQAVELLGRSAAVITTGVDVPVGPGQYRFVRTHAWVHVTAIDVDNSEHRYLAEEVQTTWVPADPVEEWQLTQALTGNLRWLTDEQAGRAAGVAFGSEASTETYRAPRGEFFGPPAGYDPWPATPEFIASLPRDPDALYALMTERLEYYGPANRWGDGATLLAFPADLLRTGLVPADLRAAFYELMARIPGLQVTDEQADVDGRVGVAFGVTDDKFRITDDVGLTHELIVDPATGDFLGERFTSADGSPHGSTAVTVGVADELGVDPAG